MVLADEEEVLEELLVVLQGLVVLLDLNLVEGCEKKLDLLLKFLDLLLLIPDSMDVVLVDVHTSWSLLDHLPEWALLDAGNSGIGHERLLLASGELAVS